MGVGLSSFLRVQEICLFQELPRQSGPVRPQNKIFFPENDDADQVPVPRKVGSYPLSVRRLVGSVVREVHRRGVDTIAKFSSALAFGWLAIA